MVAQAELPVLAAQPVEPLARVDRTVSTATEEPVAKAELEVLVRTERLEQLVRLQANLELQAELAAMVVQAELQASAAQPVVRLARLV